MNYIEKLSLTSFLTTNRFIKQTFLFSFIFYLAFIAGCSRAPELQQDLTDYNDRLNNVLSSDFQLAEIKLTSLEEKLPNISHQRPEAELKIKLNEFYGLPGCGIKPIIAERNTTLGKIQSPSQRYLYEARLLAALMFCENNATPSDAEKLTGIIEHKRSQLLTAWQVLLLESQEIQFALYNPAVNTNNGLNQDFAITRWQQLRQFAPDKIMQSEQIKTEQLELILGGIFQDQAPARIWNDMRLVIHFLPQMTDWLIKETEALNCQQPKHKTQVEYLRNVFNLFFIQKVQPQAAKLSGWLYELSPVLEALYYTPEMPDAVKDNVKRHTQDNFHQYKTAITDHVRFWQRLFKRCNVSPVAPVNR